MAYGWHVPQDGVDGLDDRRREPKIAIFSLEHAMRVEGSYSLGPVVHPLLAC